jgi:ribonucleotide monophosphatase NagD (HAD superfamily)
VAPNEAVMVGDNVETDIKGGKAAGLFSILVTESNVKPTADLSQADLVVSGLVELLEHLDQQP